MSRIRLIVFVILAVMTLGPTMSSSCVNMNFYVTPS